MLLESFEIFRLYVREQTTQQQRMEDLNSDRVLTLPADGRQDKIVREMTEEGEPVVDVRRTKKVSISGAEMVSW